MRLGLSSFIYRYAIRGGPGVAKPLTAVDVLGRAAALGAEAVQFCENLPLAALPSAEREALLEASRRLRVGVEIGMRGLNITALLAHVDLAAAVGSRALRLVLDATDLEVIHEALRPVLKRCAERQVVLAIENHFDLRTAALAELMRRLDDPWLGVCLDTANSTGHLEQPTETLALLRPYVRQVHLKDYAIEKAPIAYRITGRPLGRGALDPAAILQAVMGHTPAPDLFLEQWMPADESLEATLANEQSWVDASVRTARNYLAAVPR
ncbi:MAG TPA: TIM barrel protein [Candidatus Sulfotelmatobacter sp.]|nr:TIM barrel protein [Candidatus Sulfotelmatobacter sp.]